MPALADRAILADREWAERLGLDPTHCDAASLRRLYWVIFRVASAVTHPTVAGLQFVTERHLTVSRSALSPPVARTRRCCPFPCSSAPR
jgi:hypothetical protein